MKKNVILASLFLICFSALMADSQLLWANTTGVYRSAQMPNHILKVQAFKENATTGNGFHRFTVINTVTNQSFTGTMQVVSDTLFTGPILNNQGNVVGDWKCNVFSPILYWTYRGKHITWKTKI